MTKQPTNFSEEGDAYWDKNIKPSITEIEGTSFRPRVDEGDLGMAHHLSEHTGDFKRQLTYHGFDGGHPRSRLPDGGLQIDQLKWGNFPSLTTRLVALKSSFATDYSDQGVLTALTLLHGRAPDAIHGPLQVEVRSPDHRPAFDGRFIPVRATDGRVYYINAEALDGGVTVPFRHRLTDLLKAEVCAPIITHLPSGVVSLSLNYNSGCGRR
jgi:hypothetical protein